MTEPRPTGISPQIRILPGGEPRLLADIGTVDPDSLADYRRLGGYRGLARAIEKLGAEGSVDEIAAAGLRGRGGGGYPTADKWRAARAAEGERKVVANLIGADPTALGDRALAEGNPHLLLEGLLVAAFATGASEAIIAVRRDWTVAIERLRTAVAEADAAHLAGYLVMGTDFSCVVSVWEGSGALVAGEETALLAALAGDRGMPVIRPPYPTERGLARRTDHRPERRDPGARGLDRTARRQEVPGGRHEGGAGHQAGQHLRPRGAARPGRGGARRTALRDRGAGRRWHRNDQGGLRRRPRRRCARSRRAGDAV